MHAGARIQLNHSSGSLKLGSGGTVPQAIRLSGSLYSQERITYIITCLKLCVNQLRDL